VKAIITGDDVGTTIDFRTIGPYEAKHPWPSETVVSAGNGIVFIRNVKPGERTSYTSLFMEVYPPNAGFIRGEGKTAEECENAAWAKYQLALNCSDPSGTHRWESRGYKNGAGFCAHCSTFSTEVFSGDDLNQHCDVCGVGTTYHWDDNEAGVTVFLCEKHYVQPKRSSDYLIDFLSEMLGEDDPSTTQDETSKPDE
jgi:hypothetical protein